MANLRQVLEEAILSDPDDRAAHMAYADYLAEQDDPRGEFIQVQLALEGEALPDERESLQRRQEELFAAHGREWLGELAPYLLDDAWRGPWDNDPADAPRYQFARGWLDSLALRHLEDEGLVRALRATPIARCLRRLEVDSASEEDFVGELLAGAGCLSHLRHLRFGEPCKEEIEPALLDHGEVYDSVCHAFGDGIVELIEQMSRLEELRLFCLLREAEKQLFEAPVVQNLRVLQVYHCHDYYLRDLIAAPRLEQLLLMPHASWTPAPLPAEDVLAFLRSEGARHLTHLQLRISNVGDPGVEALIETGLLERLRVLDLRHGVITDAGAMALAQHPATRLLQRLDLQRNRLTATGIAALQAVGVAELRLEYQQVPDEGGQYNDQYLYDGDWE